jgi:hypothetical protein
MKNYLLVIAIAFISCNSNAQIPSKVDFDSYEKLTQEVNQYRKDRLINWLTFQNYSKEEKTIILDARSKEMFDRKHVKGAINLNFSDFTQENLARIIPSQTTRILIYCNNNFDNDPVNFASKIYIPKQQLPFQVTSSGLPNPILKKEKPIKIISPLTLALNVPTFINLYGYGYKNVYELSELISVFDPRLVFEGTDVAMRINPKR